MTRDYTRGPRAGLPNSTMACFGQAERTGFRNVSFGSERRRPSQHQADENSHDSGPPTLATRRARDGHAGAASGGSPRRMLRGALLNGGTAVAYYQTNGPSFGLQAGGQQYRYAMIF